VFAIQFTDEIDDALEVAELLDKRLAEHLSDVSEILLKKYGYAFYSKASTLVMQFYLSHKRFLRYPIPDLPPVTPVRSPFSYGGVQTPLSASTSCSSVSSDDMPMTPTRTPCSLDPFVVVSPLDSQKENNPPHHIPSSEPIAKRGSFDGSNDYNVMRPALQNLNGVLPSPRAMVH
jgi:hypothetical protein